MYRKWIKWNVEAMGWFFLLHLNEETLEIFLEELELEVSYIDRTEPVFRDP